MSTDIYVTIAGARGSGKATLSTQLHNVDFIRASDGRAFHFIVARCGSTLDVSVSRGNQHFTILTFDATECYRGIYHAAGLGRELLDVMGHSQQILVIGTKSDLIPHDYCNEDLCLRHLVVECPVKYRMEFRAVSSTKGHGIAEVRELIADRMYPSQVKSATWSIMGWPGKAATWALDVIAATFALPSTPNRDTPDLMELDDAKVDALVAGPQTVAWDDRIKLQSTFWGVSTTHMIAPTLLAKGLWRMEAANMQFVRAHTTIPVPQPRYPNLSRWLVMDLIDGRSLLECWDTLSLFMQFRIACTLRTYVSQMRRLTSDSPGPAAGECFSGILFDEIECGPFYSSKAFQCWCEMIAHSGWCHLVRHLRSIGERIPPPPAVVSDSWPLVYTHADLSASNVVLAKDNTLWIIDWTDAGYFPVWLETVGMRRYVDSPKMPQSWFKFRWFIAGCYPTYEWFWDMFMADVHRFA